MFENQLVNSPASNVVVVTRYSFEKYTYVHITVTADGGVFIFCLHYMYGLRIISSVLGDSACRPVKYTRVESSCSYSCTRHFIICLQGSIPNLIECDLKQQKARENSLATLSVVSSAHHQPSPHHDVVKEGGVVYLQVKTKPIRFRLVTFRLSVTYYSHWGCLYTLA